jgi:hypothetical protein
VKRAPRLSEGYSRMNLNANPTVLSVSHIPETVNVLPVQQD